VAAALRALVAPDAVIRLGHPLGGGTGPEALEAPLLSLMAAMPDLERRDTILVAGRTEEGQDWVGAMGHYVGTFFRPWLGIPPTGHFAHMRFHEFWRFEDGQVVEVQALWDIPELMLQARVWPLAPSLGREGLVPGPATQDGLAPSGGEDGRTSQEHVIAMLEAMQRHPAHGGPEVMELPRFWHSRMNWYGPAGIGTARGIDGFRRLHQIPFLAAMPDRGQHPGPLPSHVFAERNYVALTGWPNMRQTLTGGGWLGLPPTGQVITLRSLDFWRLEGGLIRENWVLVDLLDVFAQLGLDVLGRMNEMIY
jgi:predicted ester cyclase